MKWSLLELVQSILSSMDSDEVNSIGDTIEASQVANVVKVVYNDIISRANLPEHFDLFELEPSNDLTKPTLMYRPDKVQSILWLKYDIRPTPDAVTDYQMVQYMEPLSFIERCMLLRNQTEPNVIHYQLERSNNSSIDIYGLNDKAPQYYTSWDDKTVVFDSYDKDVDGTLQKNKTMCYGEFEATFLMEDDFVPDLDPRQFSLLLNEAKALAFAEIKQVENAKAERGARRGWTTLGNQKSTIPTHPSFFNTLPNYGRRR